MLLISFGTRPEYIKIKPLLEEFGGKLPYALLFTGQHTNLLEKVVSTEDVRRLKIQDGPNRLDSIVSSIMNNDHIFNDITMVMVQGDTTSAFAVGLAAFHRKLKVIHLEAGLRTYDIQSPYPEEFNRQAISRLANIHLCPTKLSAVNLKDEQIENNVYVVGNTVLDNIRDTKVGYNNLVLITMHRRENHAILSEWFTAMNSLAKNHTDLRFVIPLHPNPKVQEHAHLLTNIEIIPPLEHAPFIKMVAECKFIITDSGGIQEESSFLRKKCIVCRSTTERPEGLGEFSLLCKSPDQLKDLFRYMNENYIPGNVECPYGDGHASERVLAVLQNIEELENQ